MKTPLQWLGAVLCVAGLILAAMPTLADDPGPAADTYAAIERRVWWGGLAGLGALLIVRTRLRPLAITAGLGAMWVVAGFLAARAIGLVLDGFDSGRQWIWVALEAAIVVAAWVFVSRRSEDG